MSMPGSESLPRLGSAPVVEGAQVGAYRILRKIGDGGMGVVWLAEHTMLGRRAAIKVLHPEYSSNPEILTRFFNEARAATAVNDPGIVQVFDYGYHADGSAYIVMELLDGEPLDRRLAQHGALGLPEVLRIMRQIASTLGVVHTRGIVHRDLKPENIFIVRDSEVDGGERAKVLDFGIAKLVRDHGGFKTRTQVVMGSPRYMSPEQCRGVGQVDQRSDVYALGCLMFTLLTGRPPFDSEGVGEIIAMHLRELPPMPSSLRPGVPPEIDQLVLRCLEKDPTRRFGHGGELAVALGGSRGLSLQLEAPGSSAAYVTSIPTTLSSAMGATVSTTAGRPAQRRGAAVYVGISVVVLGGMSTIAVTIDSLDAMNSDTRPAPVSTVVFPAPVVPVPASTPVVPTSTESLLVAGPQRSGSKVEIAARMKEVLSRFVAWSRKHQVVLCPEIAALGDVPRDPWGHEFLLTCTGQPSGQVIGAVSAGPDGMLDTADDIASWQLGHEVTDIVRGSRWVGAAPPSSKVSAKPVKVAPKFGSRPQEIQSDKGIELDENGLPINR